MKGFIFDLDGVLLSTDELHYRAWKKIADKLGIPFDRRDNDRLRGVSREESLEIILEKFDGKLSNAEKEDLCTEKNEYYKELLHTLNESTVQPAVRETLTFLREKGYLLAVGSSSKNTQTILQRTKLAEYFDAVSDGNNITRSKPDPEVFLKAAKFLFLEPKDCFVVEDAEKGIDAAVAGGFCPIGIGPAAKYPLTRFSITQITQLREIACEYSCCKV